MDRDIRFPSEVGGCGRFGMTTAGATKQLVARMFIQDVFDGKAVAPEVLLGREPFLTMKSDVFTPGTISVEFDVDGHMYRVTLEYKGPQTITTVSR